MPTWAHASISAILLGLQEKLIEATELDETRVVITILPPDDVPLVAAPHDVLIRVMGEEPDVDIIDGAGRYENRRYRNLEISVRTRLHLDQTGQAAKLLTDESLGHVLLEDAVCDALELYFPTDDNDDALSGPTRVGTLRAPTQMRDNRYWVYSTFNVRVEYTRDLDTTVV